MADAKVTALTELTAVTSDDLFYAVNDPAGTPASRKVTAATLKNFIAEAFVPGGRLTLESGVPVSTTDQTAKTSVYYTPYAHNIINLWDGANWVPTTFTEKTLALGTLTSGLPYDVFGYLSAGALVLESLAWTNDTTRATAVTLQDGRYCKSGDKTRLLLGTFYTTSTTTTEDSSTARYLCNVYNCVSIFLSKSNTTNHTYTTGADRAWNNDASLTRISFVLALSQVVILTARARGKNTYFNVGDGVSGGLGYFYGWNGSAYDFQASSWATSVAAGVQNRNGIEYSAGAGSEQREFYLQGVVRQ